MTITKTQRGYQVTSKSGKPLSKKNISKKAAQKRLASVEHFKRQSKR
tara:strand:+ start:5003 stop:5143 length:141 start_codon:yes stop_codon:yes gene_type:complete